MIILSLIYIFIWIFLYCFRFGYFDVIYLDRVLEELGVKGVIKEFVDDLVEYKEYLKFFGY